MDPLVAQTRQDYRLQNIDYKLLTIVIDYIDYRLQPIDYWLQTTDTRYIWTIDCRLYILDQTRLDLDQTGLDWTRLEQTVFDSI